MNRPILRRRRAGFMKNGQSSEDIEEQGFNIDRSDTMRTLKPSASIPIRSHTRDSLQEDFR